MKVTLLNAPDFKPYSLSMVEALASRGIQIDLIGNSDLASANISLHQNVSFFNLRGQENRSASALKKLVRISAYYLKLLHYAAVTDSKLLHMQTHNKFRLFDRTVLNLYYKMLGKKLVFTAHNIDAKQRDGGNSLVNRVSLLLLYRLVDHILVHTDKMKSQLMEEFKVGAEKITIIPHGILNTGVRSALTRDEARKRLGLEPNHKVLLSYGYIAPYKGLEFLVQALDLLIREDINYRLIVAGRVKNCLSYWDSIERLVEERGLAGFLMKRVRFITDEETELLFTGADVLVLPYRFIFQSGVPFLSYSFGLPVIASDAGSLAEVVVEGKTGMVCRREDAADLAQTIRRYFRSELFTHLDKKMKEIREYGNDRYSWDGIAATISEVYGAVLGEGPPRSGASDGGLEP